MEFEELVDVLREHAAAQKLRLHEKNVIRLLAALLATADFWQIIDYADLPVPTGVLILKELQQRGIVTIDPERGIFLTEPGRQWIAQLHIAPPVSAHCPACEGRGYAYWSDKEFYRRFIEIAKDRPKPLRDYDQASVTPETTVARIQMLRHLGDLHQKEIIVLGAEDDLTGLAIALTGQARRVLILDIDDRLIEFDRTVIAELGLANAEAQVFDLRQPLPAEWIGRFDVFITDPPETHSAFRAFVARGIATLKGEGYSGYFGLTLRDASIFRWQEFQRILLHDLGVVVTDIIRNFNHYMNWPYHSETLAARIAPVRKPPQDIWYRSFWYRIETLPGFARWNEPIQTEDLYLDEEGSTT